MADRILDDADPAVDELRRRARRRLIGAVVLALAAATLVPLMLEKEPRKLGEDVSIRIPPVDEGKFVSRLSVDQAGEAKSDGKLPAPPASSESGMKGDTPPTVAAPTPTVAAPTPTVAAPTPASAPDAATKAALSSSVAATPDNKTNPAPAAAAKGKTSDATPAPTPASDKTTTAEIATTAEAAHVEGFVVQLAAFSDDKGAHAFANRLKKAGYPAYVEPTRSSRGTMWRVRVGGYPSRAEAQSISAKLKAQGHDGIVAAAK